MESRDLRIGNYVEVEFMKGLFEVSAILQPENGIYDYEVKDIKGMFWEVSDNIKPIKLTEDYLLKFGFEDDKITYWFEFSINKGQVLYLTIGLFKDGFYFLPTNQLNILGVKINHVHQLQNLYFALTRKELTINKD